MKKSKIKIMRADNGNFNIVTDFGVIGLYDDHSCCEYWEMEYRNDHIYDDPSGDNRLIQTFNEDENEVSLEDWEDFKSELSDDYYAGGTHLKLSNYRDLWVRSGDNGYYSCEILHELIV